MNKLIVSLLILLFCRSIAFGYEIQAEPTRFYQADCSGQVFDIHWNHVPIDIYINVDTAYSVELFRDTATTYWTRADFAEQVKMAIAEFNVSVGANIRLRYAGTTTALDLTGGIVIRSSPVANSAIGYGGSDWVCDFGNRGQSTYGHVVGNRFSSGGGERVFNAWGYPTPGVDLWFLLTHELGHALGLKHSDEAVVLDSLGQPYVMDNREPMFFSYSNNTRHWTKYEKDSLRTLYGINTGTIRTLQSGPSRGWGNSWRVLPDSAPAANITSGIGRMTERAQTTLYGWADPYSSTLKGFGKSNAGAYSSFSGSGSYPVSMPPAIAYAEPPLLSRGKPVTTSSVECCGFVGANAVDGNTATRWSSTFLDGQWITIDLGAVYQLSRIRLNWEAAYGLVYGLYVSNDNINWTTVVYQTHGDGGIDDYNVNATGRYVRMYGYVRGTGWGYSLWEFDVWGMPEYRAYWLEKDPDVVNSLPPYQTQPYGVGFVDKKIAWMSSADGITWTQRGYLSDPSAGTIKTWTDSVSVGFDPSRRVFAVLWIDNEHNGRMMTMPGIGSPQTGNVYSPLYVEYWEAPSIACLNPDLNGASGCLVVGMQRLPSAPLFVMAGTISSSGTWSNSVAQQYNGIPQSQAPAVWPSWSGDNFLIASLERGGSSFSIYRRTLFGSTLTYSGGYGFSGYFISPPVLGGAYSSGWSHAVAATVFYGP